jgi:hypothetical protein
MMVFEELSDMKGYEEASILFDEVVDVVKSPAVREYAIKAAKAAAMLSAISVTKYTYKYLKEGGFNDLKKAVVKATRKA